MKKFMWALLCLFVMTFSANAQSTLPKRKLTDSLYLVTGIDAAKQTVRFKELQAQQKKMIDESGLLVNALGQKAKIPDFTLNNAKGKSLNLANELLQGPVILLWYQGGWNKYCALTLRYFQAYLPELKKYGASVIAISPEIQEKAVLTQSRNKITYDVVSDKDNALAKQFGIVYTMSDSLNKEYETLYGISKYSGNTKGELPLPAAYLVNTNSKVAFTFLNSDLRLRIEPNDLLRVLKGMAFPPRK